MSLWSERTPYSQGMPHPSPPMPTYRSALDRARVGSTPDAQYPSGYLGTTRYGRRDDLFRTGQARRSDQRDYDRGIHHGSRMRAEAYTWPDFWQPDQGVRAQARGVKQRPMMEYEPVMQVAQGKRNAGSNNPQWDAPRTPMWR